MAAKKASATPNYRSSKTGRYTTKKKAEKRPDAQEKEKRK